MALLRGGSIGVGAKAMAEDFGQQFGLDLETDSSAAEGVATRTGVGKIRHLHCYVATASDEPPVADLEGERD